MSQPIDKLVADLLDAVGAAEGLVERGRQAYDADRINWPESLIQER